MEKEIYLENGENLSYSEQLQEKTVLSEMHTLESMIEQFGVITIPDFVDDLSTNFCSIFDTHLNLLMNEDRALWSDFSVNIQICMYKAPDGRSKTMYYAVDGYKWIIFIMVCLYYLRNTYNISNKIFPILKFNWFRFEKLDFNFEQFMVEHYANVLIEVNQSLEAFQDYIKADTLFEAGISKFIDKLSKINFNCSISDYKTRHFYNSLNFQYFSENPIKEIDLLKSDIKKYYRLKDNGLFLDIDYEFDKIENLITKHKLEDPECFITIDTVLLWYKLILESRYNLDFYSSINYHLDTYEFYHLLFREILTQFNKDTIQDKPLIVFDISELFKLCEIELLHKKYPLQYKLEKEKYFPELC